MGRALKKINPYTEKPPHVMMKDSSRPQIHSFNFTANNCHITIAQPMNGARRSANLQHAGQCPIPSIEPGIKQEPEGNTSADEMIHQDLCHQLPLRSCSGETTSSRTFLAPGGDEVGPVNIFTTTLPWQDEMIDEHEENKIPEVQVAGTAAEDNGRSAQVTCNFEDDATVIVESLAYHDHDPSPSPNSPLIGSPARAKATTLEPIVYTNEGSEDDGEMEILGDIERERQRPHHGKHSEAHQGHDPESKDDLDDPRTPHSSRIKTISPKTDRMLSGRRLPHTWRMLEREAVILLRKFTRNSWDDITKILRVQFSTLSFRKPILEAQWVEWSFAFWEESKYDECKRWQEWKPTFQATAQKCGVELKPVEKNKRRKPTARKDEHRHAAYRRSIRKWLSEGRGRGPSTLDSRGTSPPLSSPLQEKSTHFGENVWSTLLRNAEDLEASPHQSKVSLPSPATIVPSPYFFGNKRARPRLLFRVYHSGMPGTNSPNGFRSGRRSQIPRDGSMDLPSTKRELLDQAMIHLMGLPYSCFVATTTSLVWTLYKGLERNWDSETDYRIGRQHVVLIDADKVPESTVYHAGSLIGAITTDREESSRKAAWDNFRGHGYKAFCEWMIWGEIPAHAILFDVPLEKLMAAATTTSTIPAAVTAADFLSLPHLISCAHIKSTLLNARKAFNSPTGRVGHDLSSNEDGVVLGWIATVFGFAISSDPGLLVAFVHAVCQGWNMMTESDGAVTRVAEGFLEQLERTSGQAVVDDEVAKNVFKAVSEGLRMANEELVKERKKGWDARSRPVLV